MSPAERGGFVEKLHVNFRAAPVTPAGDPLINGRNVWPPQAPTFVPGNDVFAGFRQTWTGSATPLEMLSCSSPKGDWLHVELWQAAGDRLIVKMYTDWN